MIRTALVLTALAVGTAAAAQPARDPAGAAGRPETPAESARPADPVREQILSKLNNLRVTLEFNETPLVDAIDFIRQFTNLNLLIDNSVNERFGKEGVKITLKVRDLPLGSALRLMLETQGMTLVYRDKVLLVVTEDRANQTVVMQVYDVRDLLMKINDFPGPEISLEPLKQGVDINPPQDIPQITEDFVVTSVKQNCGKATWDTNPKVSIVLNNGLLVVTQTQDVHKQIRDLLNKLRANK
jgi:type II secretory pathway component GspD/PulD (secretin)